MKKFNLSLLAVLLLLGTTLTACGSKEEESVKELDNIEEKEDKKDKEKANHGKNCAHKYFDTSKFDASKFSGTLYDYREDTPHTVGEILASSEDPYFNIKNDYFIYTFTTGEDKNTEYDALDEEDVKTDKDFQFIKNVLGDPTCIYEKYYETEEYGGYRGENVLVYDYGTYVLLFEFWDLTLCDTFKDETPRVYLIDITTKENWLATDVLNVINRKFYVEHDYKLYGKDITE